MFKKLIDNELEVVNAGVDVCIPLATNLGSGLYLPGFINDKVPNDDIAFKHCY